MPKFSAFGILSVNLAITSSAAVPHFANISFVQFTLMEAIELITRREDCLKGTAMNVPTCPLYPNQGAVAKVTLLPNSFLITLFFLAVHLNPPLIFQKILEWFP